MDIFDSSYRGDNKHANSCPSNQHNHSFKDKIKEEEDIYDSEKLSKYRAIDIAERNSRRNLSFKDAELLRLANLK